MRVTLGKSWMPEYDAGIKTNRLNLLTSLRPSGADSYSVIPKTEQSRQGAEYTTSRYKEIRQSNLNSLSVSRAAVPVLHAVGLSKVSRQQEHPDPGHPNQTPAIKVQ